MLPMIVVTYLHSRSPNKDPLVAVRGRGGCLPRPNFWDGLKDVGRGIPGGLVAREGRGLSLSNSLKASSTSACARTRSAGLP